MENPVDKENHSHETAFDLRKMVSTLAEIWKAMEEANLRFRRAVQRVLLKILVAAVCLAIVTLIAQAFRSRLATAIIGYVVTLFLLACFAFAHLLAKGLEYIELRTPTQILRLPISFGFGAVVFFRAVILFVAQFLVDVYVSLCSGGLQGLFRKNGKKRSPQPSLHVHCAPKLEQRGREQEHPPGGTSHVDIRVLLLPCEHL